jgi:hypothetical protein
MHLQAACPQETPDETFLSHHYPRLSITSKNQALPASIKSVCSQSQPAQTRRLLTKTTVSFFNPFPTPLQHPFIKTPLTPLQHPSNSSNTNHHNVLLHNTDMTCSPAKKKQQLPPCTPHERADLMPAPAEERPCKHSVRRTALHGLDRGRYEPINSQWLSEPTYTQLQAADEGSREAASSKGEPSHDEPNRTEPVGTFNGDRLSTVTSPPASMEESTITSINSQGGHPTYNAYAIRTAPTKHQPRPAGRWFSKQIFDTCA